MNLFRIDYETFSRVSLGGKDSVGTYNYASHPSTEILMLGYKLPGDAKYQVWQPHLESLPKDVKACFLDPTVTITAFHSTFERYITKFKLGIDVPISRWLDSQPSARYLSMPGDLDEVCTILKLPKELAKDKHGEELIKLFSEPQLTKKKRGQEQTEYRNNWQTHPAEWQEFVNYCIQDVRAEEECARRMELLGALPLPDFERQVWEFDQTVNDRGMPVDRQFVERAYRLALRSKAEALERQNQITGLENSNSTTQIKAWLKARGYPFNTIRKETVDSVLKDPDIQLTDDARQVLKARNEASSTSYQKLNAIMRQLSSDNCLRGQFIYMGSARCGRWAGNAVQLHNMARPMVLGITDENPKGYDFEDETVLTEARNMVLAEDYEGIKKKYGSVLLTIKSLIRTVFSTENV